VIEIDEEGDPMARIHFAADHGGYELARALEARARAAGHEAVWHGAEQLDPGDDYPVFAIRVGQAVITDQDAGVDAFGTLVLGEGFTGVIAANKVNGARAVQVASPRAAVDAREIVDANVLVFDGIAFEENAWLTLSAFVKAALPHSVERGRRILQIEEYENAGTIEGWAVQLEPEQIAVSRE
jgi:ribose 5-phosphate isomerase B